MPLLTRSTRYRKPEEISFTTVNVFFMELVKLFTASIIQIISEKSFTKYLLSCYEIIILNYVETLKVCFPAVIYTFQNNLYYVALSHLEPATYCLVHQIKIFITALLLRLMLGRRLSWQQWCALALLAIGVAEVQMHHHPVNRIVEIDQKPLVGFAAVLTMCFTSAFAGVYMEKVLKQSAVNIWMQNIRLALLAVPISCASMLFHDYAAIKKEGILHGFDSSVWLLIFMNSTGGLLISIVVKYADSIAKAYAQSGAIVGATFGSWILFKFAPSLMYCIGAISIITSVIIYTSFPHT